MHATNFHFERSRRSEMERPAGVRSQTGSLIGTFRPKRNALKVALDKQRSKTRVNIGLAWWKALKAAKKLRYDVDVALLLLDMYERTSAASTPSKSTRKPEPAPVLSRDELASDRCLGTKSESRPDQQSLKRSSSTETCESVSYESPGSTSPSECSVQSSGKEQSYLRLDDSDAWRGKGPNEGTTKQPVEEGNPDKKEEQDEEFRTPIIVGDERYVVDLESSSEFVVDEECILQLFSSCRECNRLCAVRKHVKGLQLVVYQTCCFCQSHSKWTNLPTKPERT